MLVEELEENGVIHKKKVKKERKWWFWNKTNGPMV